MANWWDRKVVPQLIRVGCGCQKLDALREPVVGRAAGRVLELGIGAGANLRWYDRGKVAEITAIEPSEALRAMSVAEARRQGLGLSVIDAAAEALPFAEGSFDSVVCTYTLCTVADPAQALREVRRVLRPGGHLLFCEHGLAPQDGVARWQRRIEPVWARLMGGCHLARPVRAAIEPLFRIEQWNGQYQPGAPRFAGWMESGVALTC